MGLNEHRGHARTDGPDGGVMPRPAAAEPPQSFRIDIGELVLDGFDARVDPDRVSASFERELARLVHERGVPLAADGSPVSLDGLAGLPPLPRTTSPARLGEALARSVHAGLMGRGESR
ncbi:hypothetical protein OHU45_14195 [Streptomyces tubercidicus]|uniref:hypothetical protein n=1 Tax=Streptomyces tubercidicus TaxID=47759 RepID=UPI0030E1FDA8|nr:hypothetical protein OG690_23100 [Streptomyces tubercidicus]